MSANRAVILALTAAAALVGPSLWAQGSHRGGGGRPGGGGHPGRSYAVPRGGAPAHPGYSPRGGVAATRHPRAGTGRYAYSPRYGGHYSSYGGSYSSYGGSYSRYGGFYPRYGGYYPRYGGYYGYYRPYWNASFYFGWPYGAAGGWPYGYDSPSDSVSYYGYPVETPEEQPAAGGGTGALRPRASNGNVGRVRIEVRPDDASVYVDDEFWGNARDTKFLTLRTGRHSIELVRPGFEVVRRDVDVVRGETSDVLVELHRP